MQLANALYNLGAKDLKAIKFYENRVNGQSKGLVYASIDTSCITLVCQYCTFLSIAMLLLNFCLKCLAM